MEKKYFLLIGKVKTGPFTIEELKNQNISEKDMIWYEGLSTWEKVINFEEIKELIIISPPLTPHEIRNKEKNKIGDKLAIEFFLYLFIITILTFFIAGGFSSDERLEELYPSKGQNAIYADAHEIRYSIIPRISLIVGLSLSLIISLLRYVYLIKVISKKTE